MIARGVAADVQISSNSECITCQHFGRFHVRCVSLPSSPSRSQMHSLNEKWPLAQSHSISVDNSSKNPQISSSTISHCIHFPRSASINNVGLRFGLSKLDRVAEAENPTFLQAGIRLSTFWLNLVGLLRGRHWILWDEDVRHYLCTPDLRCEARLWSPYPSLLLTGAVRKSPWQPRSSARCCRPGPDETRVTLRLGHSSITHWHNFKNHSK
jgi:hypothetical protein